MSEVTKSEFFKRQTSLIEIGQKGQEQLQNASVLVIGCGGLGSAVAVYLASSGIGKLHLVDFDTVEASNLHRQVFYTIKDIGHPKSSVLSKFIQLRTPFTKVTHTTEAITKETIFSMIEPMDIVVDATDSIEMKYLINDACVLKNKPLVYGSLYKFDGYVASFNILQDDKSYSANLRDTFPTMKTDIPNCEEAGTLNAIVGVIALLQVNEVLKLITGVGKPLTNELLIYNSLENRQFKMTLTPTIMKDAIAKIFKLETYLQYIAGCQREDLQIDSEALNRILKKDSSKKSLELIAVLPNLDLPFSVSQTIPIQQFNPEELIIDNSKTYVMVCQKGLNSYKATKALKEKYPTLKVFNLSGGLDAYKNTIPKD